MAKPLIFSLFYLLLMTATVNAENKSITISDFAEQMYLSWKDGAPLPHISKKIIGATDNQAAIAQYLLVQKQLIPASREKISGYKAGLTSEAGQKKFAVSAPISGILLASGELKDKGSLSLSTYRKLMLETEIGFILAVDIDRPVASIKQLQKKIEAIIPVIELPNLAFADLTNITGQDIVASNAIANRYLLGTPLKLPLDFAINKLKTTLTLSINNKESVVNQGIGKDALGDQWQALLWLVNERLEAGYHLRHGQFLITGALGKMIPAQEGSYHADFAQLGKLSFTVTK